MKKSAGIFLLFAISLIVNSYALQAQTKPAQNDEVVQALQKYDGAWNKKDVKTVEKFLASDYIYFTSRGGTSSREETLAFLGSPKYIIKSAERSEIKTFRTGKTPSSSAVVGRETSFTTMSKSMMTNAVVWFLR